jgi:hypothetical protein
VPKKKQIHTFKQTNLSKKAKTQFTELKKALNSYLREREREREGYRVLAC